MGKIAAPYGVAFMTTLALAACMGNIGPAPNGAPGGASPAGTGGTPNPGSGGSALTGGAGSSLPAGTAGVSGTAGNGAGGTGGMPVVLDCSATAPGRSPMRRLTTYEYNNTIRDLLGDTTNPGSALPAQVDSKQNLFGNDADEQSPSALLIEKYQSVAESVAARATASTTALAKLHTCASSVTTSTEASCARMIATSLAPRAYRRTVATSEIDDLVTLYSNVRALSTTMTFASGVAAMIEAMLQSPDFLYRVELGTPVAGNSAVKRVAGPRDGHAALVPVLADHAGRGAVPGGRRRHAGQQRRRPATGAEAARRFEVPSDGGVLLRQPAADPGPCRTDAGRDHCFRSGHRASGSRCGRRCSASSSTRFFENTTQVAPPYAPGSWPAILTAPYTFVNQALFNVLRQLDVRRGRQRHGHDAHEGDPEHHAAPRSADPGRDGGRARRPATSRTRCSAAASSSTS